MKKRVAGLTMAALIMQAGFGVTTAWAQDDMQFGVDEAQEVNQTSPVAEFLTEGKKLYEQQKFAEASLLFHKVLTNEDPAAEASHPEAQYELAKTLFRMKLYQGSLSYFGQIVDAGDTHPYYLPALRGLVLMTDAIPEDPTLMARLEPYSSDLSQVPDKYKQQYAYLLGRYLYNTGSYDKALQLLELVSPSTKSFVRARYVIGVTHVANYDGKKALQAFKEVLRVLLAKKESGQLEEDEEVLVEQTYLAMARVFYSVGDYNKALKYYGRISRKSANWPKALFESSWAHFQLDLYNKALGNLHSLASPFFTKAYFPEANILSAVLFFYNCKYRRVRYTLEEFEFAYMPLRDEVDALLTKNEDSTKMFEWLNKLRSGQSEEDEKLTRILAASLDDKEVLRKLSLIEAIGKENNKLKDMPSTWRTSDLGAALLQDTVVAKELAINDAGELVKARLERVKRELDNLILERERILFEVSRAEQGELEADWRAEQIVSKDVTGTGKVKVNDKQLYWTFDGEYWKDELGYYLFNINTECKR